MSKSDYKEFIPYGRQDITDADVEAVVQALKSPFLTTGPKIGEFEKSFTDYLGVKHAVAVANGTAALHLASLALGIEPGDVVLAPTMSFSASANGSAYCGAKIEFVDCDPETGLIRVVDFVSACERVEARGEAIKAAIIVHMNGEHADMETLASEACERNILLIEDACHALGTEFDTSDGSTAMVGACRFSSISTFSTHPVKTVTTGEGGVITTNDDAIAARLMRLRNHGIEREEGNFELSDMAFDSQGNANPWYYELQNLGFNYRLTDFASALGASQMSRMPENAQSRRKLKAHYDQLIKASNLPVAPIATRSGTDPVRHLYPVLIEFEKLGIERSSFMNTLRQKGIGSQVHYIPIHLQPHYRKDNEGLDLPGANYYYERVLSLPLYATMTTHDVARVVEAIGDTFAELGKKVA